MIEPLLRSTPEYCQLDLMAVPVRPADNPIAVLIVRQESLLVPALENDQPRRRIEDPVVRSELRPPLAEPEFAIGISHRLLYEHGATMAAVPHTAAVKFPIRDDGCALNRLPCVCIDDPPVDRFRPVKGRREGAAGEAGHKSGLDERHDPSH